MKTTNVIIVCVTAIICTALLGFAIVKKSHGCHKRWENHEGREEFHHEGREEGRWHEKGEREHEGRGGHFGGNFDPEEAAEHQTERMKEGLGLKEDQVSKVEAINLKYAEKKKAIFEGIKGQMETLHTEKTKELSTVLDKEQLAKFEKFIKDREEHRGHDEGREQEHHEEQK